LRRPLPEPLDLLARFERDLAALKAELVESETSASYLMLLNENLSGETLRQAGGAAEAARDLWIRVGEIDQRLANLRERADQKDPRGKHAAQFVEDLIAPLREGLTPEAAIEAMGDQHASLCRWAEEVHTIWTQALATIDAARHDLVDVTTRAEQLGITEPRVQQCRDRMEQLESILVTDPLSLTSEVLIELEQLAGDAIASIDRLESDQQDLDTDYQAAARQQVELQSLYRRAEIIRKEATVKIGGAFAASVLPAPRLLAEIASQFGEIGQHHTDWQQKRFMLERWQQLAARLQRQLERINQHNEAALQRREELRGRLMAYRAKSSNSSLVEDQEFASLVQQARHELYTAPTDLDLAEQYLAEIAERLTL